MFSLATVVALTAHLLVSSGAEYRIPFEKFTLEQNGLQVVLAKDSSLPVVAVNVWYNVGPVNEPIGRSGFAHLFEHLMFQGSKYVGDDMHFKYLEAIGASSINGTTDYDRTNYFETVPANQLEMALWLESDRMGFLRSSITQEKLDNQRDVVMNERRQSIENVPYGPSSEKLVQTLFPETHPYYSYVIGSMEDLRAASLQDVYDFYDRYYAPSNATLVIAGDFDTESARQLIQKYFGTLSRRQNPETYAVKTPPINQERRVTVQEPIQLPKISMAWLSPPIYAEGDADCDVLAYILGAGKSSRLYKRLVYDLQIAQNVSASQESLVLTSIFRINISGRPGVSLETLEAETQKVIDEIKREQATEREVMRARNLLLTSSTLSLQRTGHRANMLNRYNLFHGDPDYLNEDLNRYKAVTPKSVHQLAAGLLQSHQRAVVITVPQS